MTRRPDQPDPGRRRHRRADRRADDRRASSSATIRAPASSTATSSRKSSPTRTATPLTSEGIFVFSGSSGAFAQRQRRRRRPRSRHGGRVLRHDAALVGHDAWRPAGPARCRRRPSASRSRTSPTTSASRACSSSYDQTLTATEVFSLGRFGEVSLSGAGRLYNTTAVALPGAPAQAVAAQNARSRIVLDDANNQQNIDPTRYPQGGLSATNTLRVGDTLDGLTGVLEFRFSNYRIQPVGAVNFIGTNLRTTAPAPVGGNLKVASFNVLNYFNGDGAGGGFPTCRGANTTFEFDRQEAKIVSALKAIDADIVGLMEIENDGGAGSALAELVAALNAATAPGHVRLCRHGRDRDRRDQGRADLQAGRRLAGRRVGHPHDRRRPALHRHAEPADARADVPAPRAPGSVSRSPSTT